MPPTSPTWSSSSTFATQSTSAIPPAAVKSSIMSRERKKGRVAKAVIIGAVPPVMVKSDTNPGGTPIEAFDGYRAGVAANRAQIYLDVASGRSTASTGRARRSAKA